MTKSNDAPSHKQPGTSRVGIRSTLWFVLSFDMWASFLEKM